MTDEQFAKGLGHMVGSAIDLLDGEDKARAALAIAEGICRGLKQMSTVADIRRQTGIIDDCEIVGGEGAR